MSGPEESDGAEAQSHALNGLLADLNIWPSSSYAALQNAQSSSWTFPPSSSRSSPLPHGPEHGPTPAPASLLLGRRTPSREQSTLVPELDSTSLMVSGQQQTLFNTPTRSILSSGPPTSSISANTAQASMSAPLPHNSSHPLSSLSVPASSALRRPLPQQGEVSPSSSRRVRIARAEKDTDDPSGSMEDPRSMERRGSTPTALARLFAAPEARSPAVCRHASYTRAPSGMSYTRGRSYVCVFLYRS